MDECDLIKSLWNMANAITAFAIIQPLGFVFTVVTNKDIHEWIDSHGKPARYKFCSVALIGVFAYGIAVYLCYKWAQELNAPHQHIWMLVTIGRILAIVLITALIPVMMFGKEIFGATPRGSHSVPSRRWRRHLMGAR